MTYVDRGTDGLRWDCLVDGCKVEEEPDLAWVNKLMLRGAKGSDVDWFVELGGHFLFIEYKGLHKSPEGEVKQGEVKRGGFKEGQRNALKRLGALPTVTVLILRERLGGLFEAMVFDGRPDPKFKDVTHDDVCKWLKIWVANTEEPK